MGVHGFWKLLEPVGKIIPLEGMAGKVLAIDVSIWLHQAMKGMHDSRGAPIAVAHLLILFHRLCKLLFYKIKPVFVFDGGVPALKRETMAKRRKVRAFAKNEAMKVKGKLLKNLMKHAAVRQMLSHADSSAILGLTSLTLPGSSVEEELFRLPPLREEGDEGNEDKEESLERQEFSSDEDGDVKFKEDIHSIDVMSSDFKNLPPEVRHEILLELIETRKQSSWKHLDRMPKELDNFSDFQMSRLLKRRAVQSSLDEASKEMGGHTMSMKDLESLLLDRPESLLTENCLPSMRIAQNEDTRYLLIQKSDGVEGGEKSNLKAEKDSIGTDPRCSTSSDSKVEPLVVPKEEEVEELTQEEIHEVIKKENEIAALQTTKLSKNRKMKITEDLIEVLPLLNAEAIGLPSSHELSVPGIEKIKEEVVENVEMQECFGGEHPNAENSWLADKIDTVEPRDKTEDFSTNIEIVPGSSNEARASSDSLPDAEQTTPNRPASVASEDMEGETSPVKNLELSEESGDDFEPVPSLKEYFISSKSSMITPEDGNKKPIEIFIRTDKQNMESEDLFLDVFKDTPQSNERKEEVKESEKESSVCEKGVDSMGDENLEISRKDLIELENSTVGEYSELVQEQGKQERLAQSISEQMNLDAQELLRLFGVPYVVAPMEAEAQCAVLDMIGLTDGTITDDSDIWLFGGKVVYRNFFNQQKHVLQYRTEDIHKYFKLAREDMIKIAMLVGSDYTSGLEGIGPVTALEILGTFPDSNSTEGEILSGLKRFRDWFSNGTDIGPLKRSLRRKIRNLKIIPGFPNEAVFKAYLNPQVDDSKEPFSWAKPNLELLQEYTKLKFGWSKEKCNDLLSPVIKRMIDNKKYTTLEKYFHPVIRDSDLGVLSKRVLNALKKLGQGDDCNLHLEDEDVPKKKSSGNKRKCKNSDGVPGEPGSSTSKISAEIIPQKVAMEKILQDRKRSAVAIYKKSKNKKDVLKRKRKNVVQEVNLSESSSDSN